LPHELKTQYERARKRPVFVASKAKRPELNGSGRDLDNYPIYAYNFLNRGKSQAKFSFTCKSDLSWRPTNAFYAMAEEWARFAQGPPEASTVRRQPDRRSGSR
jgi:hypothetical protein